MKLHSLDSDEDLNAVASRMWDIVNEHYPDLMVVMARVAADDQLDRPDMIHAGFLFGAAFALSEMVKGHVKEIGHG